MSTRADVRAVKWPLNMRSKALIQQWMPVSKPITTPITSVQFDVCKICSANRHGICGALKIPELVKLGYHTTQRTVEKGAILQYETDETHEYVNIVAGVVKLTKLLPDGRQQIVGLQFPPEFVGRPYADNVTVTAEAASDLEICVFSSNDVNSLLSNAPEFERRMLRQTLKQLDTAQEWMLALGRKTASEKLASLLSYLARAPGIAHTDENGAVVVDLVLSRSEIAEFLGLTTETVSREFTKLRQAGTINPLPKQRMVVPSIETLELATGDQRSASPSSAQRP